MVELRNVRKQFEEKPILDGTSLEVERCDRLVIMGQSGSAEHHPAPHSGDSRPIVAQFFKQFEITRLPPQATARPTHRHGLSISALLSSRNVRDNVRCRSRS
jgi:ABC-type branched-subunit amino acid transport system ATPase component